MPRSRFTLAAAFLAIAVPAAAQQRPLLTEDPEPIGTGRVLVEGGLELSRDAQYPVAGLEGNLSRVPAGVSIGLSSIAEFQFDTSPLNRLNISSRQAAPLSGLLNITGTSTHGVDDTVLATKIRVIGESQRRPAFGLRFATKLPTAGNETGLGLGTTDFSFLVLAAKTVQSIRMVGNIGLGILGDPTEGHRQNDVMIYGLSFARALTERAEVVGEIHGRVSTRAGDPFPGTDTRGLLNLGGRYTTGPIRFDASFFFGLTAEDPTVGMTVGFTYVFNAFQLP